MPFTTFVPNHHGFDFVNTFVNHPFRGVPLLGLIESFGLCGGMPLAALKYFIHGLPIPNHRPIDFDPMDVPPEGSRLYNYLYDRQIEAFGPLGVASAIQWRTMPWVSLNDQYAWSFTNSDCDFNKVKASVDRNLPTIIGLRPAAPGGTGLHAVLAIGYDDNPKRVYVYDSNHANVVMELRADDPAKRITYQTMGSATSVPEWGSFFVTGSDIFSAPPTYVDLVLQDGIHVITQSSPAMAGQQVVITATVHNSGDFSTRVERLIFNVIEPSGATSEIFSNLVNGPIQPGEDRTMICSIPKFGAARGNYILSACYRTIRGNIVNIPATGIGSENPHTIFLDTVHKHPHPRPGVCEALRKRIDNLLEEINMMVDAGVPDGREGAPLRRALLQKRSQLNDLRQQSADLGCH